MNCLVTGGRGFIGAHVAQSLQKQGHAVVVYDIQDEYDICDYSTLRRVTEHLCIDVIFHFAGVLGTSELIGNAVKAEKVNVIGTLNVLEVCKKKEIPLIYAGKINPTDWLNPYTISKRASSEYCKMYAEQWDTKICELKFFNAYGPGQKYKPVQKFMPTFIVNALQGKPLPVWGSGKQELDPIYINDIVKATVKAWEREVWGHTIEIGTGIGVPVIEVAELVIKLTGSDSEIEHLPMRSGEPKVHGHRVVADTLGMRSLLKMCRKHLVSLERGVKATIKWWQGNAALQ